MRVLDFGKNKGKILAECEVSYLKWLATHEKVLAKRNRWAARDAKFLLERMAQVAAAAEHEARKEAEMVVRIAEHIIATPAKIDLGLKGNFYTSRTFSLMR